MKPEKVNILGICYTIEYTDKPSDVDIYKKESLWGQVDYWTRTIRVYDNERTGEDIWQTIFHEVLHGIVKHLHLDSLDKEEDQLDMLALALVDVLFRNNWMKK